MEERRVTFRFGAAESEVHFMSQLPEVGNLVTHDDALWIVASVDDDESGPVVTCALRLEGDRAGAGNV